MEKDIQGLFHFFTFLDEPVKKATFAKSAKLVKNANLFKNPIQKTPDQIEYDEKNEGISSNALKLLPAFQKPNEMGFLA